MGSNLPPGVTDADIEAQVPDAFEETLGHLISDAVAKARGEWNGKLAAEKNSVDEFLVDRILEEILPFLQQQMQANIPDPAIFYAPNPDGAESAEDLKEQSQALISHNRDLRDKIREILPSRN